MSLPNRITPIDGLRGLAILGIIIFHVATVSEFQWSPIWNSLFYIGRQGIILFFIISGYAIRKFSLPRYFGEPSPKSKLRYLLSRFFKLSPLYYFILFVALILLRFNILLGITSVEKINATDILLHLVFLHSLFPKYFLTLVSVAWILGLEVYYYFISIALYRIKNYKLHLFLALASMAFSIFSPLLIPYFWPYIFLDGDVVWLENSPLVYFVFFYAGYLIAEFQRYLVIVKPKLCSIFGDIVFFTSAALLTILFVTKHNIVANFFFIPLFTSIFLPSLAISRIFSLRFFSANGIYAYALFLVHSILLRVYLPYLGSVKLLIPLTILFPAYLIAVYISSFAISYLLYHFIEIPGIIIGKKILNKI